MADILDSFYDLQPVDNKGQTFDFKQLEGKVVLIVNQYKGLEDLYKKYENKNFVILGFPCNQFGRQEPGTDEEISSFCTLNYGVTFPVLKKIDVNGDSADPVYKFIKSKKAGILGFRGIKWNFEKFLIDSKGQVVQRYSSVSTPESIEPEVEKLISST
ncbi:thioredoxin-like protein [Lipomyces japonicus]|uniref:thioredoxin-like protein n=1 Tax=Lipomyces japonicus TaxID=56871 RepID=UPI0034CFCE8D